MQPWYLQLYPDCDAVAVHVAESANAVAVPIAVDSVDASHTGAAVVDTAIVAAAMLLGSAILLAVDDVPAHGATVHTAADPIPVPVASLS